MSRHEWTAAMHREVSGFGARGGQGRSYETTCRLALLAALDWLDEEPQASRFPPYQPIAYEPARGGVFIAVDAAEAPRELMNDDEARPCTAVAALATALDEMAEREPKLRALLSDGDS